MRLKVILNQIEKHPGFVYERASFVGEVIEVQVRGRENGRAICSRCNQTAPGYDRLPPRRYEYVPLWGIRVFFVYAVRRVECRRCAGVIAEQVPWATGKQRLTTSYVWFLARWARRLSWLEVGRIFHSNWSTVCRAVEIAVQWGRAHMELSGIEAIGIDEVHWRRGPQGYLSVIYEIGARRRLLWVGHGREGASIAPFFEWLGEQRIGSIRFVCSDMWRPYLKAIRKYLSHSVHVLDRFHIAQKLNVALDVVRAQEARRLKQRGFEPVLTHTRWCLLKRPQNLSGKQRKRLRELLQYNVRTVRAYLLKEDLQWLWQYKSATWAGKYLDQWCTQAMRSRIDPIKQIAVSLRRHRQRILNWFEARGQIGLGATEGFNTKVKLTTRKAYGFRSPRVIKIALYHTLGALPEPEDTHRFC